MNTLIQRSVNYLPARLQPWIKHIPGLREFQRLLISRALSEKTFVHTINAGPAAGLIFEVTLPIDKAVWAGTYELAFASAIAKAVRPGDVCYDIGGYRGYMSGIMALAGASKVFVFEPVPTNQQALRRLCELNRNLPIELMALAAGPLDGQASFRVMPDPSMGKLASSTFQQDALAVDEIGIDVMRIDTLVRQGTILAPNVMKIDVEGAELDVLRGSLDTLQNSRPVIFLEAHSKELEFICTQLLRELGYRVRRIGTEGEAVRHSVHIHTAWDA